MTRMKVQNKSCVIWMAMIIIEVNAQISRNQVGVRVDGGRAPSVHLDNPERAATRH